MNVKELRIVFLGTPTFAVASLAALVNAGYNIVGVVTAPDKQAGRGLQLIQSAVKQFSIEHNLFVLQPEKLKAVEFIVQLKALNADMQVVVAFRMLPEIVWNMPPMGTINVHGSLLPQYRGAAPINWAIINGEKETGVTTFKLQHAIDTGNILLQQTIPISSTDTAGIVHDTMMMVGAKVLLETIEGLCSNNLEEKSQTSFNEAEWKHAPKIFTDTCAINWDKPALEIYNLVRGLAPYPTAYTQLDGKKVKVFNTSIELIDHKEQNGLYFTDNKNYLKFSCSNGFVHLLDIQLEGKKRMLITDFLKGYRFK